jgi:hypothetical protein
MRGIPDRASRAPRLAPSDPVDRFRQRRCLEPKDRLGAVGRFDSQRCVGAGIAALDPNAAWHLNRMGDVAGRGSACGDHHRVAVGRFENGADEREVEGAWDQSVCAISTVRGGMGSP